LHKKGDPLDLLFYWVKVRCPQIDDSSIAAKNDFYNLIAEIVTALLQGYGW